MSIKRIIGQAFAVSGNANNGVNVGALVLKQQLSSYQNMLPFRAQIIFNGKYYTFKGSDNEDSTGL